MLIELIKLKVVKFLLDINIKIGRRLAFHHARLSAGSEVDEVAKKQKFDLRSMPDRLKNIMLHDQDIIDKRWAECEKCEFLTKTTSQCTKCMCFMKVKTRVASARCPLDPPKWDIEYNFMENKSVNGLQPVAE